MLKTLKIMSILHILVLLGCDAQSSIRIENRTIYLKGYIDEDLYSKFSRVSLEDIDRVKITSSGGETLPALKIAHLIKDYKMDVISEEVCLSACASIIFVAGEKRYVSENTLLAFHIGSYSRLKFYQFAQNNGAKVTPSEELIQGVREEKRLYERVGADRNILLLSMTLRGKPCYVTRARQDGTTELRAGFSNGGGFIPTKSLFASYGIRVEGDNLPEDASDLKKIEKNLPQHDNLPYLTLANESDAGLSEKEILRRIDSSNYKPCPKDFE